MGNSSTTFSVLLAIACFGRMGFSQDHTVEDVRARYGETLRSIVSLYVATECQFMGDHGELVVETCEWAEQAPRAFKRSMQSYQWAEEDESLPVSMVTIQWDDGEWCWSHSYELPSEELGRTARRLDDLTHDFQQGIPHAIVLGWRLPSCIDQHDNLLGLFDRAKSCEISRVDGGWQILFHEVRTAPEGHVAFAITFDPQHDWLPIEYKMFAADLESESSDSTLFPQHRVVQHFVVDEFSLVDDALSGRERWFPNEIRSISNPDSGSPPVRVVVNEARINTTLSDDELSFEFPFGTQIVTRLPSLNRPAQFYVVGGNEAEDELANLRIEQFEEARTAPAITFPIVNDTPLTDASVESHFPWLAATQALCAAILIFVCGWHFYHARKERLS